MKSLRLPICALLLVAAGACSRTQQQETAGEEAAEQHNIVYGINADNYRTETGEVGSGETLGKILNGFGVSVITNCGLSDEVGDHEDVQRQGKKAGIKMEVLFKRMIKAL